MKQMRGKFKDGGGGIKAYKVQNIKCYTIGSKQQQQLEIRPNARVYFVLRISKGASISISILSVIRKIYLYDKLICVNLNFIRFQCNILIQSTKEQHNRKIFDFQY
eukprot:TRINITY_DN50808_c0_g1_i2.p3 TRINITY_DN50808_c0_g1~~TRINITY_DN50808_c0_g1_i2.p3  ORF type:complete len:114 (-),score=2.25 TRINITY_DN50808_c0_g1_i2:114-431(-)